MMLAVVATPRFSYQCATRIFSQSSYIFEPESAFPVAFWMYSEAAEIKAVISSSSSVTLDSTFRYTFAYSNVITITHL